MKGDGGIPYVNVLIKNMDGIILSIASCKKLSPLVTPRHGEGGGVVTSGSNMEICAHHRAHENLNIFGFPRLAILCPLKKAIPFISICRWM
jgi:hypothetical protein